MADKEPKENQKTPNVNFINFQRQLRGIIKDIKEHKKKKQTPDLGACEIILRFEHFIFIDDGAIGGGGIQTTVIIGRTNTPILPYSS
mgnify:CR=1 FL=1